MSPNLDSLYHPKKPSMAGSVYLQSQLEAGTNSWILKACWPASLAESAISRFNERLRVRHKDGEQ